MVRNEEKYQQAILFRKRGFTLEEIAKICIVSKGTLSKWFKNKDFSEAVTKQNKRRAGQDNAKRLMLMSKARGRERSLRYKEIERSAEVEFKHYKKDPRFIAGLTLYAAAGDLSNDHVIRLPSSRIVIHQAFIRFSIDYLGVSKSKLKLRLILSQGQNEEVCMRKWQQATTLPFSQFSQVQILKAIPKKPPLHHGVGNTIIGSTVLKRKLVRWIELLHKELAAK